MCNPFAILNLKESYVLDPQTLEKHYFEAQKKNHPDQFSQGTDQEKKDASEKSTAVNQAYLLLKSPLSRAEYLLKTAGFEPLSHDPSVLGAVMEWNERLEKGEDLAPELLERKMMLYNELERNFEVQDYEKVRSALYQLTYMDKLSKQNRGM